MIIKEFDTVKLKDGREGTILEVFTDVPVKEYLFESDSVDEDGVYEQITIKESEIEKII